MKGTSCPDEPSARNVPFSNLDRLLPGCAVEGGAFQWVRAPPGEMLQPDATGATVEVTKRLKPSVKLSRNTVTVRVCRP